MWEISFAQHGSLLISIIITKLTPELHLCIARESKNEAWEMEKLLGLIKQEVEARESSELIKVQTIIPSSGSYIPTRLVYLVSSLLNYC